MIACHQRCGLCALASDAGDRLGRALSRRPARRLDPCRQSFYRDRARDRVSPNLFAPEPRLAVILTFGQSQMANEGAADARMAAADGVYNFNFFDGRCHAARDPLLGTTLTRANLSTRIGDDLVRAGVFARVLLVPIAHGGTFIAEWAPGGRMFPRIAASARRLRARGIRVTHALWQQGETDAAHAPDADAWMSHFRRMLAATRALGIDAPVFVALGTRCQSPPSAAIRAAQSGVVDPGDGVFAGPDTDELGPEFRWDGCHFNAEGLMRAARLWRRALAAP